MPEDKKDANTPAFDLDAELDRKFGEKSEAEDTAAGSSPEKDETGKESDKPKASEDTPSQKSDETKGKEEEVPKEFHKHPAWQRILKERDEAKQKAEETQKNGMTPEELQEIRDVIKSPEYRRMVLTKDGWPQEAIDKRLREEGFDVPEKGIDDITLIAKAFGKDPSELTPEDRETIKANALMVDTLFKDRISKVLPQTLKPLQEDNARIKSRQQADDLDVHMRERISSFKGKDGKPVLDYSADIEPKLREFMDKNPKATMKDIHDHFRDTLPTLIHERLSLGTRKAEKEKEKEVLRPAKSGVIADRGKTPDLKGKDVGSMVDTLFEHLGA